MELQALIDGLKAHKSGAASYESVDEAIRVLEAMRDVDVEKVVNGLEHCKTEDCSGCLYEDTSAPVGRFGTDELVACKPVLFDNALALIRQQQERIAELEAANASWQKFAPFLHAHVMPSNDPAGCGYMIIDGIDHTKERMWFCPLNRTYNQTAEEITNIKHVEVFNG